MERLVRQILFDLAHIKNNRENKPVCELFQGALIGAGASVFGVGSDIAGSIRVPAMFNGIFGHKPTGDVTSVANHFPSSTDENFSKYLVVGPMCRYARDLPTLVHIMAGKNAAKLRLDEPLFTKDIKVSNMFETESLLNELIAQHISGLSPMNT